MTAPTLDIHFGDNLSVISEWPDESFDLIYIDPPFNTGKVQARTQIKTVRDDDGDREGYKGHKYRTVRVGTKAYSDIFSDYLGFLEPRLEQARRLLKPNGSFFLHLDYREVHYAKVLLDMIFGRESFMNEIIWAYDYGGSGEEKMGCQARQYSVVCQRPRELHLPIRRHRPHPIHGTWTCDERKS